MISHKYKIIFIHIPKCAGSSIEEYFHVKPFKWSVPNYENLTGWCPKRKIHLHHATAKQLLELDLIDENTWNTYYKFAIVRNPWSRALSDYLWFNRNRFFLFNNNRYYIHVSFKNYLKAEGSLKKILTDNSVKEYRGDHLIPQCDFIKINEKIVVDKIIRFENLKQEFDQLIHDQNLIQYSLPHSKKAKKIYQHYSHFYFNSDIELVRKKYLEDVEEFNYEFSDQRESDKSNNYFKFFKRRFLIRPNES